MLNKDFSFVGSFKNDQSSADNVQLLLQPRLKSTLNPH